MHEFHIMGQCLVVGALGCVRDKDFLSIVKLISETLTPKGVLK